jgi:tRNA1Val (adenine37-N6)-methyltransferase
MSNNYFIFKNFKINQEHSAFKVGTDGVLLGACADVSNKKKILDVGTGTGLIALMLAQRCDAEIVAIEPDHSSFIQASDNINSSIYAGRIKVENSSLQEFSWQDNLFDMIISNPPYFIGSLKNTNQTKAFTRHNSSLTHNDLLNGTNRLLKPGGLLQLILPLAEGNKFIAEAFNYGFFCNTVLKIRPVPSSEIKRLILGFSTEKKKFQEHYLTIENGNRHEFTNEYIKLTKDFYLEF